MDFGEAIRSGFQNYVTFRGRASRSEFWFWTLFAVLLTVAAHIVDGALFPDTQLAGPLVSLFLFLPGLAVAVRRLHDLDRGGWWLLIVFTGIGIIVLLIWDCMRGTPGPNRFGADPLAGVALSPPVSV
jgi:uncharacterized membrane protein YhaH (DUF805 family)